MTSLIERYYDTGLCPVCDEGSKTVEVRYSFGIYAMTCCAVCWRDSGYRDEPASAFDPAEAGERLDDDY